MTTAVDLLHRPYQELSRLPELAGFELPEPDELDDISGTEFTELGFSVTMHGHETITQIVLYSGAEGAYSAYPGELPRGLLFLMTPDDVHDLLGPPDVSRASEVIQGIGLMRPLDKYMYAEYRLSVHYSLDHGRVALFQFDVS